MCHLITVDNIAQPLEHGAPPFYQLLTKLDLQLGQRGQLGYSSEAEKEKDDDIKKI